MWRPQIFYLVHLALRRENMDTADTASHWKKAQSICGLD